MREKRQRTDRESSKQSAKCEKVAPDSRGDRRWRHGLDVPGIANNLSEEVNLEITQDLEIRSVVGLVDLRGRRVAEDLQHRALHPAVRLELDARDPARERVLAADLGARDPSGSAAREGTAQIRR